jgi:HD-like signal output (HDOD) protein
MSVDPGSRVGYCQLPAAGHLLRRPQDSDSSADSEEVTLSSSALPQTSDARLEACLTRIESRDGFPALTQRLQELTALLDDEETSAQRLANIVLRDYGLTIRVIRAANSYHYNRSGCPVLTATHAMVLLGVDAVRNLVSGLLLFEYCQRQSPGLKQLMLLSMLTANHARELALRLGVGNPEEAYLCGMFRNLGEVMTASCLEEEYAAILREVIERKRSPREACTRVLGFEYQDLGQAMARRWSMPPQLDRVIRAPEMPRDRSERIAVFSEALTSAVYRRDPRLASPTAKAVVQKYGPGFGLSDEDVRTVLENAVAETRDTFRVMRVALDDLRLRHQIDVAIATESPAPQNGSNGAAPSPPPDRPSITLGSQMASEVEAAVGAVEGFNLHRVLLMALEAGLRGGGFDRTVFALVTSGRDGVLGRLGLGHEAEMLVERFRFSLGLKGGPVGAALARQQELVLSREWDLRPDEVETLQRVGAASLVVLPVVVQDVLVGCMYFDCASSPAAPDNATLGLVRRLRDAAAAAMARRSNG